MSSSLSSGRRPLYPVLGRIAAAVLGGYVFCWGFIALGLALLYGAGMSFHDAEHLASILGLLLFVGLFCWAFAARSLGRVWLVLAGGGVLMVGAATLLQHALLTAAGGV